jgi:hypothetical protein
MMSMVEQDDIDKWPIKTSTDPTSIEIRFKETLKSSIAAEYYKDLLKTHGSRVKQLYFSPHSDLSSIMIFNGGDDYTMGIMNSCINNILEHCTNLKNLLLN